MNVLLRGLCERQIDDMLNNSLIQEYSRLLEELDIPEESMSKFLMGYLAGCIRSKLNASSLVISNRPLNGDEIEIFSKILGRRMDDLLEKIFDNEIKKYAKEGGVIEEPQLEVGSEYEEASDEEEKQEVPLRAVATIGNLEVEEEKFSFKISGRKKSKPTILGIPVKA
jgi:hypothetical protein